MNLLIESEETLLEHLYNMQANNITSVKYDLCTHCEFYITFQYISQILTTL